MNLEFDFNYFDYPQAQLSTQVKLDIILINGETQQSTLIPDLTTNVYNVTSFNLEEILQQLEDMNYPIKNSFIQFKQDNEAYVPCGSYPFTLPQSYSLNLLSPKLYIEYTAFNNQVDYNDPFQAYLNESNFFDNIENTENNNSFDFLNDMDFSQDSRMNNNNQITGDLFGTDNIFFNSDNDMISQNSFQGNFEPNKKVRKTSSMNESSSTNDSNDTSISEAQTAQKKYPLEIQIFPLQEPIINPLSQPITSEKKSQEFFPFSSLKKKRARERTIKAVMEAVFQWRRIFRLSRLNGDRKQKKCTLGQAAAQVGHSKKSLDDYLLQLRYGAKFGFNFEENKYKKIGVLRAFVKKEKKKALKNRNIQDKRTFLKSIPFQSNTLTTEMISLLTDLKPVKSQQ